MFILHCWLHNVFPFLIAMSSVAAVVGAGTVFSACHVNVVTLEWLTATEEGRNFGFALTFIQFIFIALCTLPFLIVLRLRRPCPPFASSDSLQRHYNTVRPVAAWIRRSTGGFVELRPLRVDYRPLVGLVACFWAVSTLNNVAFSYNISVLFHTIFRSSSLLVNVLLGWLFFKKVYSRYQIAAMLLITVGLVAVTTAKSSTSEPIVEVSNTWLVGMSLLVLTSLVSPLMGQLQDLCFGKARSVEVSGGSHLMDASVSAGVHSAPPPIWIEALCLTHLLSIPLFLWNSTSLFQALTFLSPSLFTTVTANVVSQLACISGVYSLTSVAGSFTLTLVLSLRKFISVVYSLLVFGYVDSLSSQELVGIVLVGVTAALYPFVPKGV